MPSIRVQSPSQFIPLDMRVVGGCGADVDGAEGLAVEEDIERPYRRE